jgi:hypothetical protein
MMRALRLAPAMVAGALLCSLVSSAQAQPGGPPPPPPPSGGYYGPPPVENAGGFFNRRGLAIGFGFGIGGMSAESGPIECTGCDYEPAAGGVDFHIGAMINPRLALLFEVWGTGQAVDAEGRTVLVQTMLMGAIQYWLTPQLWLKGGLGASQLSYSIDDGYETNSSEIDSGGGVMGAIGYEVMSGRKFAIDLQLRVGRGTYERISEQAGTFSVGFNWF